MGDLSNRCCMVVDNGMYTETAIRLAREFGQVLYYKPWTSSTPKVFQLVVGDGYEEIKRVRYFWEEMEKADLFVFPDLYFGDLQIYLESIGKRVWGARNSEKYEYNREMFLKSLDEVGLEKPNVHLCIGITELTEHLKKNDDKYIKISITRGDMETWHHQTYELSEQKLNGLRYYYGPCAEMVRFQVWDDIPSDIEVGYDGPSVDGKFFDSIQGYESKNQAYIGAFTKYQDMPEQVREVNDKFAKILQRERARTMFGTEIRVTKDGTPMFIDATVRQPCPPGECQLEVYSNLGEVMWHGAVGDIVPIEPEAEFCAEVMIYSSWAQGNWSPVYIPPKVRRWVKLLNSCEVNGFHYAIPEQGTTAPAGGGSDIIGAVVGLGKTIEKAIEAVREHCDEVEGFSVEPPIEALADCLASIKTGEENDVHFTDKKVPEPSEVLDE